MERTVFSIGTSVLVLMVAACGDSETGGGENNNLNNEHRGVCGDGYLDTGEECDEGVANSDSEPDACRTSCRLSWCGDNVQDSDESCDDGDDGSNRPDGCPNTCLPPACGDGHVLAGHEACDDGNTVSGDDCRGDCLQDLTLCGNSLPDIGEQCDDGAANADDVPNACRRNCQLPVCGDGILDSNFAEECDDASNNSDVNPDACRTSCRLPRCGDQVTDMGEMCDDGNNQSNDGCSADCLSDESCGNGIVDPSNQEACDDGGQAFGDGCSPECAVEHGWYCEPGIPSVCQRCPDYHYGAECGQCTVFVSVQTQAATPDGRVWSTAFATVQAGIDAAFQAGAGCEVWVAAGTYYIYQDYHLDTVALRSGVAVYGGFEGTEGKREQRDIALNMTVLHGANGPSETDHVYHVVTGADNATLDGFVITAGRARAPEPNGGGMYNRYASPRVANCTFLANVAESFGGGLYSRNASPTVLYSAFLNNEATSGGGVYGAEGTLLVMDSTFIGNTVSNSGGGLYFSNGTGTVFGSTFSGNTANLGGGLSFFSLGQIRDCKVTGNHAVANGGGLYIRSEATLFRTLVQGNSAAQNGGGVYISSSSPWVVGCQVLGNQAALSGGGVFVSQGGGSAHLVLQNSVLADNTAGNYGGGLATDSSDWTDVFNCTIASNTAAIGGGIHRNNTGEDLALKNTIIWGNTGPSDPGLSPTPISGDVIEHCNIQDGGAFGGPNNIDKNPLFVSTGSDPYQLQSGSPCVDAGLGDADILSTDILGATRFDAQLSGAHGGAGTPAYVDMGAYEYNP